MGNAQRDCDWLPSRHVACGKEMYRNNRNKHVLLVAELSAITLEKQNGNALSTVTTECVTKIPNSCASPSTLSNRKGALCCNTTQHWKGQPWYTATLSSVGRLDAERIDRNHRGKQGTMSSTGRALWRKARKPWTEVGMAAPPEGDHAVRARSCITGRLFLGPDSKCKSVSFMTFNEYLVYRAFFQSMIHFYKIFLNRLKKKSSAPTVKNQLIYVQSL